MVFGRCQRIFAYICAALIRYVGFLALISHARFAWFSKRLCFRNGIFRPLWSSEDPRRQLLEGESQITGVVSGFGNSAITGSSVRKASSRMIPNKRSGSDRAAQEEDRRAKHWRPSWYAIAERRTRPGDMQNKEPPDPHRTIAKNAGSEWEPLRRRRTSRVNQSTRRAALRPYCDSANCGPAIPAIQSHRARREV